MIGKTGNNMTNSAAQEWQKFKDNVAKVTGKAAGEKTAETAATTGTNATNAAATTETAQFDPKAQLKEMVASVLANANKSSTGTSGSMANMLSNNKSGTSAGNSFDSLLKGLGLDNVTGNNAKSLNFARAQFELNYQAIQTISGADGSSYTNAVSFSLKLDFQSLTGAGGNPMGVSSSDSADDIMSKMQEYFSPEKTADRILGFALNFFGKSEAFKKGGDTEESRQAYSDYIGKAIQKGFDQAMGILGKVSNEVQAGIDDTHTRVFSGLNDFVKDGMTEKQQQRVQDAMAWNYSFSMQMSQTQVLYTPDGRTGSAADSAGLLNTQG